MRTLALVLISAAFSQAQQIGIQVPLHAIAHPVAAYHSTDKSTIAMFVGSITLAGANAGDYFTTRLGAYPGTNPNLCELNPLFRGANACKIDVPRFTTVKAIIEVWSVVQWVPVWTGHASDTYKRINAVIDLGLGVPLGIAVGGNIKELKKYGVL